MDGYVSRPKKNRVIQRRTGGLLETQIKSDVVKKNRKQWMKNGKEQVFVRTDTTDSWNFNTSTKGCFLDQIYTAYSS